MSQTTTEDTKVSSFQDREGHYTLSLVDAKTGHRYVHRIKHAELDGKALAPMVGAELKRLEDDAGKAYKSFVQALRRQRGQLGNAAIEDFHGPAPAEAQPVAPPTS